MDIEIEPQAPLVFDGSTAIKNAHVYSPLELPQFLSDTFCYGSTTEESLNDLLSAIEAQIDLNHSSGSPLEIAD